MNFEKTASVVANWIRLLPRIHHSVARILLALLLCLPLTEVAAQASEFIIMPDPLTVPLNGSATYTVRLSVQPATTVTLRINAPTSGLSLQSASDFDTGANIELQFSRQSWNQQQTVTVIAGDQSQVPTTRRGQINHRALRYRAERLQVMITDDMTTATTSPGVTVSSTTISIPEGGTATYTVVLNTSPRTGRSATIGIMPPSFVSVTPTALTFNDANWNTPQTVTITGVDDPVDNDAGEVRTADIEHTITGDDRGSYVPGLELASVQVAVMDDDTAGVTVSLTTISIPEGGAATYTMVLNTPPRTGRNAIITIMPPSFVNVAPTALTFNEANWNTPQTVTVTGMDDFIDNPVDLRLGDIRHTIENAGSDGGGYIPTLMIDSVGVTVTDDDMRGLVFTPDTLSIIEGGTDSYGVALASRPVVDATVSIFSGISFLELSPDSLTFKPANWMIPQRVTVTALQDNTIRERDRVVEIMYQAHDRLTPMLPGRPGQPGFTYARLIPPFAYGPVTVSIIDIDRLALSVNPVTVSEGSGTQAITVTAATNGGIPAPTPITVSVSLNDNTATLTDDYAPVADIDITIPANTTSGTGQFNLIPVSDNLDEPDETIDVVGTASGFTVIGAEIVIADDDDTPSFSIADAQGTEGGSISFTVTRMGATNNVVSVQWSTVMDTATEQDYTAVSLQTLTFAAGQTSRELEVGVNDDDLDEPDQETFMVRLSGAANVGSDPGNTPIITDDTAIGTINDNDDPPAFSVADASGNEGDPIRFTVIRAGAADNEASLRWRTADGTATSPADFSRRSTRTLTFAAGETSKTLAPIRTEQDTLDEPDETFELQLLDVAKAADDPGGTPTITTPTAVGTIIDDDDTPGFTIADAEGTEGGPIRFEVTRTGAVSNEVSVQWTTATGTATGADFAQVLVPQTLTFASGVGTQTVTVDTTEDMLSELDEAFQVELNGAAKAVNDPGGTPTIVNRMATGIIRDNDAAPTGITLEVSPDTVGEGSSTQMITVMATLDGGALYGDDRTVTVNVGGGSATASDDYRAVPNFDITIPAGTDSGSGTFTLILVDDVLDEPDETIDIAGTSGGLTVSRDEIVIQDNDVAPTSIMLEVSPDMLGEGSRTQMITVTATVDGSTRYSDERTVTVSVENGTAEAPADYGVVRDFDIIIPAGADSSFGTFMLTPVDDTLDESDETINITGDSTGLMITSSRLTIGDNDEVPSFEIVGASATEGSSIIFEVTRMGAVDNEVSVQWMTVVGTATGGDFTEVLTPRTLIFASGQTSRRLAILALEDRLDEPDETFEVRLDRAARGADDPGGTPTIAVSTAVGTINDNDDTPGFTIADAEGSEGDSIRFVVTRTGAVSNEVSVEWMTVTGTAGGEDFTEVLAPQVLTFASGVGTQTVTVDTTEDMLFEADETFRVELSEAARALNDPGGTPTITDNEAVGTIRDDDAAPTGITLEVSPDTLGEGSGTQMITVTATVDGSTRFSDERTVTVSVGGGTAEAPADYGVVRDFDIIIPAGADSSFGTFMLTPVDDTLDESDETINITGDSTGLMITSARLTIGDNDEVSSFEVANASGTEGSSISFEVTRTGAVDNEVSVQWMTVAGTAGREDFTEVLTSQTLIFTSGQTSRRLAVLTLEDRLDEPDETFEVRLDRAARGADDPGGTPTIAVSTAVGTINDNDDTPGFTIADAEGSEGDSIRFVVTRTGAMDNEVSVQWTTVVGTATGGDFTEVLAPQVLIFASGVGTQTVTVDTTEDMLSEADETFRVELSEAARALNDPGGTPTITDSMATGTIRDDDAAPTSITLEVSPDTLGEGSGTQMIMVTATVDGSTFFSSEQTVMVSVGGGAAEVPADYAMVPGFDITIPAGMESGTNTFTLIVADDAVSEPSDTIDVTGASGGLTINGDEITITDDDAMPGGITLTVSPVRIVEGNGTQTVTVTVTVNGSTRYGDDRTVTVSVENDTAEAPIDYGVVTDFDIVILAGADSGTNTFMLVPVDDTLDESDETINITGDSAGLSITSTRLTLADDDETPSFEISDAEGDEGDTLSFTVTRLGAVSNEVTVEWATMTDTATGDDFREVLAQTLTFGAGETRHDVMVATIEDRLAEGSETFEVRLSGAAKGVDDPGNMPTIRDGMASGTIRDDDVAPMGVTLEVSPDRVGEGSLTQTMTVTATVDGSTRFSDERTVTVSVGGGTAEAPADYGVVRDFDIIIPAGADSSFGTFMLTPVDDTLDESDETINITGDSTGLMITSARLTIGDNDEVSSFEIANASGTEGSSISFEVTRTGAVDNEVSVQWMTVAGTAGREDFTEVLTSQTLIFTSGQTSRRLAVLTLEDRLDEPDETFEVRLDRAARGADDPGGTPTIAVSTAVGTINDNDDTPGFTIADAEGSEGDSIRFVVTRTGAMDNEVSVQWTTVVGTATGGDFTEVLAPQVLIFASGVGTQTVTVDTTEDMLSEADETFRVELSEAARALNDPGGTPTITDSMATGTIRDDDAAPTSITLEVSPDTLGEGSGTQMIMVTATVDGSTRFSDERTVTVSVGGGTAEVPADYAMVPGFDITIPAGMESGTNTFTLIVADDAVSEPSDTIDVTGASGGLTINGDEITITDDDAMPGGITLTVSPVRIVEGNGTQTVTVTATVNGSTRYGDDRTVTVSVENDTAEAPIDYGVVTDFDIVILAGADSGTNTFMLVPVDDTLDESDETINITGDSAGLSITSTRLTLADDDETPSFEISDAAGEEGDTLSFTVTRLGAVSNEVTVEWATMTDTATGDDFREVLAQTLTFGAGETRHDVMVATIEDRLAEGSETFEVRLSGAAKGVDDPGNMPTIRDGMASGTIRDDDVAPMGVTLEVSPDRVGEGSLTQTMTVTATVDGSTRFSDERTVTVSVGGGTAEAPADYGVVRDFDIIIPAGADSSFGTFMLTPVDDTLDESDETINITGDSTGLMITSARLTIGDNDEVSSFEIANASGTEGSSISFEVTRTGAVDNEVSVQWMTVAGTAGREDFTEVLTSQTLIFTSGQTSRRLAVLTLEDRLDEPDETFEVRLDRAARGADDPGGTPTIAVSTAVGTINDNDDTPGFTIADAEGSEGDSIRFVVTRTGAMDNEVSVQWTTVVGTATGGDFTEVLAPQVLIFASGVGTQTVTVDTTEDMLSEADETFRVELSEAARALNDPGGTPTITDSMATGTIRDDDAAPTSITLEVSPDTLGEGSGTQMIMVTATVDGSTFFSSEQTVMVSVGGGTAEVPADYAMVPGFDITIPAGMESGTNTFTLIVADDAVSEPSDTIDVTGASGGLTINGDEITITDDDAMPGGITLTVSPVRIVEGNGTQTVTVTATVNGSTRYGDDRTVTVSVENDTAEAPIDYGVVTDFDIVILAGADSGTNTFMLVPVDDTLDESDETINITGDSAGLSITSTRLTLADDDETPSFEISDAEGDEGDTLSFTVTRLGAVSNEVTVEWATMTDTATGDDFREVLAQTLTFGAGETRHDVMVATIEDRLNEGEETFEVRLSGAAKGVDDPGNMPTIADGEATGTIRDDDAVPTSITLEVSPDTLGEGSGTQMIMVTATVDGSTRFSDERTVTVSVGGGTVEVPADYTMVPDFDITIPAGAESGTNTFTLTVADDAVSEPSDTIDVTGASGGLTINGDEITITDDDAMPGGITLTVSPARIVEGDGTQMIMVMATVNGSTRYSDDRAVTVSVEADTAEASVDYGAVTDFDITIPAGTGSGSGTFMLVPVDDALDEPDETINITGDSAGLMITSTRLTLADDDETPSFEISDAEGDEGDTLSFTVTRLGAVSNEVTVEWATMTDTATGDDFQEVLAQTLTFGAGETRHDVMVATIEDRLNEGEETFEVRLSGAAKGVDDPGNMPTIADGEATGTIRDDDAVPTSITLEVSPDTLGEGSGTQMIMVTATVDGSTRFSDERTVTVSVGGGTVEVPADYTMVPDFDITIPAGAESGTNTFTLTVADDAVSEPSDTIDVTGASGGLTINGDEITITDDDAMPGGITLTVSPARIVEGDGTQMIMVMATVNGSTRYSDDRAVTVSVEADTAEASVDYGAVTDFDITIPAGTGSGSGTFMLVPVDDALDEPDETINITGDSAGLMITSTRLTIEDDDATPASITLEVNPDTVSEGSITQTIMVTATVDGVARFSDDRTVAVSVGGGSASLSGDYEEVVDFDIIIPAGTASSSGTFTLTLIDDGLHESDEVINVTGTLSGLTITADQIRIIDDDVTPGSGIVSPGGITLTVSPDTIGEGSGTHAITVTATMNGGTSSDDTVVAVSVMDGTATAPADYAQVVDFDITIMAGAGSGSRTFELTPINDALDESDETIEVIGVSGGLMIIADQITIMDDDMTTPTVTLVLAPATIAESGGGNISTVTAILSGQSHEAITIEVQAEPGSGTVAGDYLTSSNRILTIAAGETMSTGVVTLTAVDNDMGEPNKTVVVSGMVLSGGVANPVDQTLTIADDDNINDISEMEATQEAWLPRFGLTVAEHALGGLSYRFSTAGQSGLSGNLGGLSGGQALNAEAGRSGGAGYGPGVDGFGYGRSANGDSGYGGFGAGSIDRVFNQSRSLTLPDILRGSHFIFGDRDGTSVWGRASYSNYTEGHDDVSVDGDVTTGMLGIDYEDGDTLRGLALSHSGGGGDWSGAQGEGELSSHLWLLMPYMRHDVTERLQAWGAAGYGLGGLRLSPIEQSSSGHDIYQLMMLGGLRGTLVERTEEDNFTLSVISDVALVHTRTDDSEYLRGMETDSQRLRLGLEWSWLHLQADGGRLTPELELGMRYDDGGSTQGVGMELGGGISWEIPSKGLTLDLRGRRLLEHENQDRREWGLSGSMDFDLLPDSAHGPSLSLQQEYGNAPSSGGLEKLLSGSLSDSLQESSSQVTPVSKRWTLKGEWGFAMEDGAAGVPYAGLSSSGSDHNLTLGWRMVPAPGRLDAELDIKAIRRESGQSRVHHGVGVEMKLRW